jgi:N-acyl homoserine lactone hydrolase
MKQFISIVAASLALGGAVPASAQPTPARPAASPAIRLYALDCGLTEFKDADVFSDTGDYEGK